MSLYHHRNHRRREEKRKEVIPKHNRRKNRYNGESHGKIIDNIDKIELGRFHRGFDAKIIHEYPYIVKLRRFLNTEEIETLLNMSKHLFSRSTTVVDNKSVVSSGRTSQTAFITENGQTGRYPKPIYNIINRVCYLVGCSHKQVEGIMVVKYEEGEEYNDHHDYFPVSAKKALSDGGQRIATFFCYLTSLNDGNGGETEFPEIGVKVKPSRGTAVFWWDTSPSRHPLTKTLHRGNPVKKGIKYGLNIWIRDKGW